jgi:hypothetical protein
MGLLGKTLKGRSARPGGLTQKKKHQNTSNRQNAIRVRSVEKIGKDEKRYSSIEN